jgi:hypothetical protein
LDTGIIVVASGIFTTSTRGIPHGSAGPFGFVTIHDDAFKCCPGHTDVIPRKQTTTCLSRRITRPRPLATLPPASESRMATRSPRQGGFGVLHRNLLADQAEQVDRETQSRA